ncbi:MAG: hypothetical protein JWM37_154 [Candidatus Saccharibacteria bacterium]|nr:hypothetical protein [Candidatus Saccharibacteria bacterium]
MESAKVITPNLCSLHTADDINTPGDITEGIFYEPYEELIAPVDETPWEGVSFGPNPAYDKYLRIHKVFVGQGGAALLEETHDELHGEELPRYLSAAGSAAVESAVMSTGKTTEERLALLDEGVGCWQRALRNQRRYNQVAPECLQDLTYPYRLAMDIATAPLWADMIRQNIRHDTLEKVYADCLNIAQANDVQLNLALREGDDRGVGDHAGFAYECNFLLAFNRTISATWFVVPAMARCDTGYEYRQQTHDMVILQQRWGQIRSATPTEIKCRLKREDKERYDALLVRGKMHLSVDSQHSPSKTLAALSAVHEGTATLQQKRSVTALTERVTGMAKRYRAGETIGPRVTKRSLTHFRDARVVAEHYAGLTRKTA